LCAECNGGGCEEVQVISAEPSHSPDPILYSDPPPTHGPHNPCWSRWEVHATEVPDERWVHNLEHGGIVYLYNCPQGCADEVATLAGIVSTHNRTLLTPYSLLPKRFGVVAWGHRLLSDCLDPVALTKFYTEHFDHGRESEDAQPDPSCPP
jgi:hypothetical protein